jgi:Na+/H+ antiporter NhaD/arsenite permease-like protein
MVVAAIVSSLVFLVSLALIFSEKVNRSIVAIAGGVLMVGLGKLMHFYSEEAALEAIDFNTLGLLLGMMILVAMLEPTGFFEYLAVLAARASKGQPLRLFVLLGSITTVLSMFLDRLSWLPGQARSFCCNTYSRKSFPSHRAMRRQ